MIRPPLTSFVLLGAIKLGYDSFDVDLATHLILWGTNGVATNRLGLQFLSGSIRPGHRLLLPRDLVLRPRLEIAGIMSLV
jgi:hypothetical protein